MPSENKNLKYSYENLTDDDKLAVDTAVGQEKYEELSSRLKKMILIWNTARHKGVYWFMGGLAAAAIWSIGFTFRLLKFIVIPYQFLLPVALLLMVAGIFIMFRRIYIHF